MERELILIAAVVWAAAATIGLAVVREHYRRNYRKLDHMLEQLMEEQPIERLGLEESGLSMLEQHIQKIQEKLQYEIGRAEEEKEQVKQMVSNISHQLKTPLANVLMYEQLLEDETLPKEQRREFIRKLKGQSEKIAWILESMFKMIRLEQNEIQFEAAKDSIKEVLVEAVNTVYAKAEQKKITISMDELPKKQLYFHPKWTREVFENLLENAVKYTKENGSIRISMESLESYTAIRITDDGIGITKEDLPHVFERFYRSSQVENVEGSGIGLYLSKMILEKEKGYLTVESTPGRGSTFTVFLQNC